MSINRFFLIWTYLFCSKIHFSFSETKVFVVNWLKLHCELQHDFCGALYNQSKCAVPQAQLRKNSFGISPKICNHNFSISFRFNLEPREIPINILIHYQIMWDFAIPIVYSYFDLCFNKSALKWTLMCQLQFKTHLYKILYGTRIRSQRSSVLQTSHNSKKDWLIFCQMIKPSKSNLGTFYRARKNFISRTKPVPSFQL